MHSHHPKTLRRNISVFAQFGYHKDLPEILVRILQGPHETSLREAQKVAHEVKMERRRRRRERSGSSASKGAAARKTKKRRTLTPGYSMKTGLQLAKPSYFARKGAAAREAKKRGILKPREERIQADLANGKKKSAEARVARKFGLMENASKVVKWYSEDPNYGALHDAIASHFANLWEKDLAALNLGKL